MIGIFVDGNSVSEINKVRNYESVLLGFTVTFLSRYLHKPGVKHMHAAKHTPRYLKGTKDLGIHYTRDQDCLSARDQKPNTLFALSDSDFCWM